MQDKKTFLTEGLFVLQKSAFSYPEKILHLIFVSAQDWHASCIPRVGYEYRRYIRIENTKMCNKFVDVGLNF